MNTNALLKIRQATPDDLSIVMEVFSEAAAWLAANGIQQWISPPNEHWWRLTAVNIENDEVYVAANGQNIAATVRLTWRDRYWPDDGKAVYVHSLAVRPSLFGQGVGDYVLNWIEVQACLRQRRIVRLDCLAGNSRLRQYYEDKGFVFRGEVTDHNYVAALYQKEIVRFPKFPC